MPAPRLFLLTAASVVCAASFGLDAVAGRVLQSADQPVRYVLTVSPDDRTLAIEATFAAVTPPLELHMSRASPGRYALHDFVKNVYDLRAEDESGHPLPVVAVGPSRWRIDGSGVVRVRYRVFGDRIDGTYLAVDRTHAHVNMPAALVWSPAYRGAAAQVTIVPPARSGWRAATQLMPTGDPLTFTAPNLDYLMDSPLEASAFVWRTFAGALPPGASGQPAQLAIAVHHTGSDAEVDALVSDLARVVAEEAAVFGEYPAYENGRYTFLADYLPWAVGDGMEHRNSTVLTSSGALATAHALLLDAAAHEFFHNWNVERIRPRGLEPFDYDDWNMTGELWLAEGVTNYYESLAQHRAGVTSLDAFTSDIGRDLDIVITSPAHRVRSAADMSRMSPLVDGPPPLDRTNWTTTFISYYTYGSALGLGLDLAIREHTHNQKSLDDFMRAMWQHYGRPGGSQPGLVGAPYTLDDVRNRLAEVTADPAFANSLIDRFVLGREVMDYTRLLGLAGLTLRPAAPGRASLGRIAIERAGSVLRIAAPVPPESPAAQAHLAQDDVLEALNGRSIADPADLTAALAQHRPGDRVTLRVRYRGESSSRQTLVTLVEDSRVEVLSNEAAGTPLTGAQRQFREGWLRSRAGR